MQATTIRQIRSQMPVIFTATFITLLATFFVQTSLQGENLNITSSKFWNIFLNIFLNVGAAVLLVYGAIWLFYRLSLKKGQKPEF